MNLENFLSLESNLKTSWVDVTFTKKDGSARKMRCTTNLELIPHDFHPKKKEESVEETDENFKVEKPVELNRLYSVYEENKGWRSFRRSQVTQVNNIVFDEWVEEVND